MLYQWFLFRLRSISGLEFELGIFKKMGKHIKLTCLSLYLLFPALIVDMWTWVRAF